MKQLTHVPVANRHVADAGYMTPRPPPRPRPGEDGSSCPVAPWAAVWIYTLVVEVTWPMWLCGVHARARTAAGQSLRDRRCPPHDTLACLDRDLGACGA